jgi:Pumilio-family RNA binding repeat
MNPSNTNPKKKYSGLFVENDGLNCFTENIPLKTENQTTASSNT